MEWKEWIGKVVFLKLKDGTVFSYSKVLVVDYPFISITDKFNIPVVINVNSIERIKEEGREENDRKL